MILHRLTVALRQQDWFTVVIETLIVVFGVFIGLQVNNWNNERSQIAQEQVYLQRLQDDFDVILERLDVGVEVYSEAIESMAVLHNAILIHRGEIEGKIPEIETLVEAANNIGSGSIPSGSSATFEEMIAAGSFSDLRNTDLRNALYDYDQSAKVSWIAWQSLRDQSIPYLQDLSRLYKMRINPSGPDIAELVGLNETILYDDPSIETALFMMSVVNSNDLELRILQAERARAVLELLNPDMAEQDQS